MQSDLLLGDQMYHLTLSEVEIPHSEKADMEYYTHIRKHPKKGGKPPLNFRLRMRIPFHNLRVTIGYK